jgi:GMP synthase-like glutamine amidotransferase
MMILFVKHIDIEGPDSFGEFFMRKGIDLRTVDLHRQGSLPDDVSHIDAVISLGGPMNVYEEEKYPFLKAESEFIKKVLAEEIPFMGICLGSQMLAKVCGARVTLSPKKEIGFFQAYLSGDGQKDALFQGLQERLEVFQWHEDMWELPSGATLLASSRECPHQAFKVGPCAYGIQFHVEVTESTIREWIGAYFTGNDFSEMEQKKGILADYLRYRDSFNRMAETVYANFLKILNARKKRQKKYESK